MFEAGETEEHTWWDHRKPVEHWPKEPEGPEGPKGPEGPEELDWFEELEEVPPAIKAADDETRHFFCPARCLCAMRHAVVMAARLRANGVPCSQLVYYLDLLTDV